jgi:hypothetical protein
MVKTRTSQNDILSRVERMGAEALNRLSEIPGGQKLVEMANETRSRLDDLSKRVRGLEDLEKRVEKLEKQLASSTTPRKTASASKSTTARKSTTPRKTTSSARKPSTRTQT